jgi:hypothetical protein
VNTREGPLSIRQHFSSQKFPHGFLLYLALGALPDQWWALVNTVMNVCIP